MGGGGGASGVSGQLGKWTVGVGEQADGWLGGVCVCGCGGGGVWQVAALPVLDWN